MIQFNCIDFLILCSTIILLVFLLVDIATQLRYLFTSAEIQGPAFGYSNHNGPHTWHAQYRKCDGDKQSPVNVTTKEAIVMGPSERLNWYDHNVMPLWMNITNEGHVVVVTAEWPEPRWPQLCGGPLKQDTYEFYNMSFHWGPGECDGSEHALDDRRFAMELQMCFLRDDFDDLSEISLSDAKDGVVIVSFLFEITPVDNPLLDNVVNNLWFIVMSGASKRIPPFPLNWMFPAFETGYYSYSGSLTQPPCSEVVTWIIQPETVAISARQLAQFRTLYSEDGYIMNNTRPVQQIKNRELFFYE